MGKKTWKERLEAIPPQKTIAALLREIQAIGIKISDKGIRNQNKKHGILVQADGQVSIRVDTVLSLGLWKTVDGDPVIAAQAATSGVIEQYNADRAREMKAKANIKEREDLTEAGDLIHRKHLNDLILAPAIKMQRNHIRPTVPAIAEEIIGMVGGDIGKKHAVERALRMWIAEQVAAAYAGKPYELTIDPVPKQKQASLIDE